MDDLIENIGINNYTDQTNLSSIEYECSNCKREVIILGSCANNIILSADIKNGYSKDIYCPICGHKAKLNICN